MIARLTGDVVDKSDGGIVLDVSGVGYLLNVPRGLLDDVSLDSRITVHTYFHVREQSQDLYGFLTEAAKALFEQLIGINGVGPKAGIAIMSLGDDQQIRQAIASGNTAYVQGAAGVGKKVAERVVMELQDKVGPATGGVDLGASGGSDDVLSALKALGYTQSQALQALAGVDKSLDTEGQVKAALKAMS